MTSVGVGPLASLTNIDRVWPDDYSVAEIHNRLLAMRNLPKARQAGTLPVKFRDVFHRVYDNKRYYKALGVWKSFAPTTVPSPARTWFMEKVNLGDGKKWTEFLGEVLERRNAQTATAALGAPNV